ncbi:factor H binding protein domain-containing protein, partial [Glaesserella parasuis]
LFFVHNKIPVSECIISETGIYTNCGRGSLSGQASTESFTNGSYNLSFFGPNAEEIGGKMSLDGNNYGLAGTRGEIQK